MVRVATLAYLKRLNNILLSGLKPGRKTNTLVTSSRITTKPGRPTESAMTSEIISLSHPRYNKPTCNISHILHLHRVFRYTPRRLHHSITYRKIGQAIKLNLIQM
jgi:hypothetical protein